MENKEKKDSLVKILEKETGYKNFEIENIMTINKAKLVTAICKTESGSKKDCSFILDDKGIFYGQCTPKKENNPKNL